ELRADFERIRQRVAGIRADTTTPDARLADDPLKLNPCSVGSLVNLMLGGIHPGHQGGPLHCSVRYFDAARRRPGLPSDVAALVETFSADSLTLHLVNLSQTQQQRITIQGGAYGEHQLLSATDGGKTTAVDGRAFDVRLAPGFGGRLVIRWKRLVDRPTLSQP